MIPPPPARLNALFIGNSYMNRQERIVPALLRPLGYEFDVRTVYAPGQSFEGHLQNDAGIVTVAQKEGIERGRIGGWFSAEQCENLYAIARRNTGYLERALAELRYDVAFILVSGGDCEAPDALHSIENARELIHRVRERNPGITLVLFYPWTYLGRPEELPQFEWLGKRIALENNCLLAPVGTAFARAQEEMPGLFVYRSKKDSHQNERSILLAAYTQICAFLGERAASLDFSVNRADPACMACIEDTAPSLDPDLDELFLRIARETTRETARELEVLSPATLTQPVIRKPASSVTAFRCDKRVLVVGNSWFDAHGAVWTEFAESYRAREEIDVHVETVTDDAATFDSILANNAGELTPRQRRILDTIGQRQSGMGSERLDPDALDGFGDYSLENALATLAARKGALDRALGLGVRWDAVLVQGFRGANDPGAEDFLAEGCKLVEKIRQAVGDAPIFLMQHWAPKGAPAGTQEIINESYARLGEACGASVIPVGAAFAATRDVELLAAGYTPNPLGIQLISETLRRHMRLV